MNKRDVVEKVAEKAAVDIATCERVLDALEKVLQEELASCRPGQALSSVSGWVGKLFQGRS